MNCKIKSRNRLTTNKMRKLAKLLKILEFVVSLPPQLY